MVKNALEELKWIEDEPQSAPPPEEFPLVGQKSLKTHFLDKMSKNLFVPVGLLATTACLTMGLVSMKRGDRVRQQAFMKGRVGFQLFTLTAMVFGMYLTSRGKMNREAPTTPT